MSKPVKHHYVPRSYQEFFRNPETNELYRLDKETGASTRSNPKNSLYQKHLYTLDNPPTGADDTYIEKPLLSDIDERFSNAIRKINNDIKSIDKHTLSICIAFLKNRTPNRIQEFGRYASEDKLLQLYKHLISDTKNIEDAKIIKIDLTNFENFKTSLCGITITPENDYLLYGFLLSSSLLSVSFFEKKWTLLVSNSKSFITSDKPVTAVETYDEDSGKTSQYYLIPLSSKFCIKSHFYDGDIDIAQINNDDVDEVNMAVAYCAERLIVGPNEQQLREIFEQISG